MARSAWIWVYWMLTTGAGLVAAYYGSSGGEPSAQTTAMIIVGICCFVLFALEMPIAVRLFMFRKESARGYLLSGKSDGRLGGMG